MGSPQGRRHEIGPLRELFQEFDEDHDGLLSKSDVWKALVRVLDSIPKGLLYRLKDVLTDDTRSYDYTDILVHILEWLLEMDAAKVFLYWNLLLSTCQCQSETEIITEQISIKQLLAVFREHIDASPTDARTDRMLSKELEHAKSLRQKDIFITFEEFEWMMHADEESDGEMTMSSPRSSKCHTTPRTARTPRTPRTLETKPVKISEELFNAEKQDDVAGDVFQSDDSSL